MHKAYLFNYPGIKSIGDDEFMHVSRKQVGSFGVDRQQETEVTDIKQSDGEFIITTENDDHEGDYTVLATGAKRDLTENLGCEFTDEGIVNVGVAMETSIENVYATGAMVPAEE